jgi:hypothetical protein
MNRQTTFGEDNDRRKPDDREAWRFDIRKDVDDLKVSMAENTRITREVRATLDAHVVNTAAVVEAYSKVQSGIKVMDAIGRFGAWVFDKWKPILFIWVACTVLFKGGSFQEAWATLLKLFKA